MAKRKKAAKAMAFNPADVVELAKHNPYVQRLIDDASIRDNVQKAVDSTRKAIDRLGSAKNPAKALIEDKKLQNELRTAIEAIRDASTSLTEAPKRRKAKGRGRGLILIGAGGVAALAASEGLRSKVLDALFGAEEEFQYTPPTGAPASEPASVA
jgi:hypothetical protein